MNKIFLLSCVFLCAYSFSQEKLNLEKASDNIQKIINYQLDNSKPNIFISDFETIDSIVKITKKKYKIIYSFSDRCHSCVETFPTLVKYVNENSEKLELLPIIGHRYKEIPHFIDYLKKVKYFKPMYLLDMEKYGTKKILLKGLTNLHKNFVKNVIIKKWGFQVFS